MTFMFDLANVAARPVPDAARVRRGKTAYLAGASAEDQVCAAYLRDGYHLRARRWRGQGGELDLVLAGPEGLVIVEVKKSGNFDRAAEALGPRQMRRIFAAAAEFAGNEPAGDLTPLRFDFALVDAMGRIDRRENALWAD